jgi:hypothetical protein
MTSLNEAQDTKQNSAPAISTVSQQPPVNTKVDSLAQEPDGKEHTLSTQSQQTPDGAVLSPPSAQSFNSTIEVPQSDNAASASRRKQQYEITPQTGGLEMSTANGTPVSSMSGFQENYNAAMTYCTPEERKRRTKQYSHCPGWNPAWADAWAKECMAQPTPRCLLIADQM